MDRREDIRDALNADEFDDKDQYDQTNQGHLYTTVETLLSEFILALNPFMLELGPGSVPVVDMDSVWFLEPSEKRARNLSQRLKSTGSEVQVGYAEDMPYRDDSFEAVIMLNGFFQVQALYEAILEINRVLQMGGRFAFNIHTGDEVNIIVGQVLGHRNLVRTLKQFGFDTLCLWEGPVNTEHRTGGTERQAFIVMEKVRNATANDLNQPQLVPYADPDNVMFANLYRGINIDLNGRESYLA